MVVSTGSGPRSASPTDGAIKAAEELELEDDVFVDVSETLRDKQSPPIESSSVKPTIDVNPTIAPTKTPRKVKAAAAMWEDAAAGAGKTTPPNDHIRLSSSSSFRSIPASSSKSSMTTSNPSVEKIVPTFPSSFSSTTSERSLSPTRKNESLTVVDEPVTPPGRDKFLEVVLTEQSAVRDSSGTNEGSKSYSLAPAPSSSIRPPCSNSVVTPPPHEEPPQKTSFFSSTLSFGFPSSSSNSTPIDATPVSQHPSRSVSSNSNGTGWRSTMSNLLGNRSVSSTPSQPPSKIVTSPTIMQQNMSSPVTGLSRNPSTSFILQRMASPTASRDRRISREAGGSDRLREGFERVRSEMEDAARDMRREEATSESPVEPFSEGGVDWNFWGAVVQDYEEVARTRPKELSRAIQQGIPPVIRGAIWQLMSSSKDIPLEETYKAFLTLSSPHEKAIAKDLSRTFPNHKFFQEGGGLGQESLFMVVKAYSLYDQQVGYTQGLAFIVAALLLNMPDEEAFCVLVRLMDSYNLRSHFLADMPGLQLRLFQFDRLLEEILPLVHTHFVKKGIKSSMFASQWFMTLFSYRFPLSLVYRVLDIVFAEGIEAIFRFSLALLRKSEDKLVELEFEQILGFLQTDLFQMYRATEMSETQDGESVETAIDGEEEEWRANDFVRDAYDVRITPFMLDSYASEYEEQCKAQNKHALELDQLRNVNRSLSTHVKQLESSLATMNQEHVELVRQLVMSKIEKEDTENELVRYKMLYAELAHAQQDALSIHSRMSASSS